MSETYDSLAYYRIKQLEETNERLKSQLMETNDTLEKANIDRNDLLRKLDTECKKKQDLQEQLDNIGKTYCKTARRVGELVREKEELQRQIDVLKQRGIGELWAMIREVNSAPIEALYGSGAFNNKICVGTIVNMYSDVRDFIKEYEAWKSGKEEADEEQKRLDYMRDYLHRFCVGKVCYGCPLNTPEFKCYGHGGFESISDGDLKRYYEKARGCADFRGLKKKEEKSSEEVPCSFNWKLYGTEYTIETSISRKDYDNIVRIISRKE